MYQVEISHIPYRCTDSSIFTNHCNPAVTLTFMPHGVFNRYDEGLINFSSLSSRFSSRPESAFLVLDSSSTTPPQMKSRLLFRLLDNSPRRCGTEGSWIWIVGSSHRLTDFLTCLARTACLVCLDLYSGNRKKLTEQLVVPFYSDVLISD